MAQSVWRHLGLENPRPPGSIRVLVVDDEPQICDLVARVLQSAGYRVETATSGPAALAAIQQHGTPDLLLTDFQMPQMNGDALAAKVRQSVPDLKVLYLTGYSQSLFSNRGTLWEGEAFLEKPCSPTGLLEGVSLLLFDRIGPAGGGVGGVV